MKTHLGSDTGTDKDIVGSCNKCWTVPPPPPTRQQKEQDDSRNRSRTGTDDNTFQSWDNKAFSGVEAPDCKWPLCLCWPL
jgi:hypothetical protein